MLIKTSPVILLGCCYKNVRKIIMATRVGDALKLALLCLCTFINQKNHFINSNLKVLKSTNRPISTHGLKKVL